MSSDKTSATLPYQRSELCSTTGTTMTREQNDASPDIKPAPGEYRCRWELPADFATDLLKSPVSASASSTPSKTRRRWSKWWRRRRNSGTQQSALPTGVVNHALPRSFTGSIELRPGLSPRGELFDWSPDLELVDGLSMEMSVAWPQTFRLDILRGTIDDASYEVCLLGVVLNAWAPERIAIRADAALVGVNLPDGEEFRFQAADFQTTGLDAVGGFTPLLGTKHPPAGSNVREGEWRATGNSKCVQTWSNTEVEVSHDYNIKFQAYDPYFFRIAFSPVVRIRVIEPLTLRQWLDQWVIPIRRIVSVATNREESITFLTLRPSRESEDSQWAKLQVFGAGITQEPFSSRRDDVLEARSAFTFAADSLNLLHMVRSFTAQIDGQNPLMETYDPVLLRRSQPPRSRFLVLVQALEGLAGYQTRDSFEARQQKHTDDRDRVVSRLEKLVDDEDVEFDRADVKFVKRRLPKRAPGSLDEALRTLFKEVEAGHLLTALSEAPLIAHISDDIEEKDGSPVSVDRALAVIRNNLSHGNRSYPPAELSTVSDVLERVARAHMLRAIGCSEKVFKRAVDPE